MYHRTPQCHWESSFLGQRKSCSSRTSASDGTFGRYLFKNARVASSRPAKNWPMSPAVRALIRSVLFNVTAVTLLSRTWCSTVSSAQYESLALVSERMSVNMASGFESSPEIRFGRQRHRLSEIAWGPPGLKRKLQISTPQAGQRIQACHDTMTAVRPVAQLRPHLNAWSGVASDHRTAPTSTRPPLTRPAFGDSTRVGYYNIYVRYKR